MKLPDARGSVVLTRRGDLAHRTDSGEWVDDDLRVWSAAELEADGWYPLPDPSGEAGRVEARLPQENAAELALMARDWEVSRETALLRCVVAMGSIMDQVRVGWSSVRCVKPGTVLTLKDLGDASDLAFELHRWSKSS